jgi:hypothetical protein
MNAKILLDTLRRRGVVLAVVGDELRYRPKRAVDETTLALLRQHKSALVELLEEEQRRGEAVRYDQGPAEGALPPPLGDKLTDLLDKLHAHGCQVEALGDGQTFRSDCPTCRMAAALDLSEGTDGLPVIRSRCRCFDPLAALEGREAVSLAEFRKPKTPPPPRKPKRPDAVCRCGSTQWRDVPIHGGRSIRRDCARCGRFLGFPLWYGQPEGDDQARAPSGSQPAPSQPTPTYWPSWAQAFHDKLVRAGCHPKIVVARGNHGKPILAIEADCPGCGWAGGLVAWPMVTGTMASRCRTGCHSREVFAGLDKRLKQRS